MSSRSPFTLFHQVINHQSSVIRHHEESSHCCVILQQLSPLGGPQLQLALKGCRVSVSRVSNSNITLPPTSAETE